MSGRHQTGISLIEVMVSMGILALLIGIALPNFRAYLQNVQTRTAAESILNGLQASRNESIRRNASYEFTIHNGTGWDICPAALDTYPCPTTRLMARDATEGSEAAVAVVLPAGADTVGFNGLGRVVPNAAGTASLTQIDISNPRITGAEARPLRILISTGGALKLCDPKVAAGDPRACS